MIMHGATRPDPFKTSAWTRAGWIALALYVVYAASRLEITWARFLVGLDNGAKFIGRMLPPHIAQPDSLFRGRNHDKCQAPRAAAHGRVEKHKSHGISSRQKTGSTVLVQDDHGVEYFGHRRRYFLRRQNDFTTGSSAAHLGSVGWKERHMANTADSNRRKQFPDKDNALAT